VIASALRCIAVAAAFALFDLCAAVEAQDAFPTRAVEVIVPYPPGGVTDIIARSLAQELLSITGKPFVVENKPGATGIIAANIVKRAAPDGYTLMMGSASQMTVLPALKPNLPFDPEKDFTALSLVGTTPYLLLVNAALPAKTVPELIQLLRANPRRYNFSTSGVGSMPHLLGEMFKQMAKVDMTHIPYQGNSPATVAVAAGDAQVTFDTIISARPLIEGEKIRVLGVAAQQPVAALPGVPTIASTLPGFSGESWLCLYAPSRTPATVIDRLRSIIRRAVLSAKFAKSAETDGFDVPALSIAQVGAFLRTDASRWQNVARRARIILE
jgi:tripartite-type tricarboxylate transporter receptor subunit TctC